MLTGTSIYSTSQLDFSLSFSRKSMAKRHVSGSYPTRTATRPQHSIPLQEVVPHQLADLVRAFSSGLEHLHLRLTGRFPIKILPFHALALGQLKSSMPQFFPNDENTQHLKDEQHKGDGHQGVGFTPNSLWWGSTFTRIIPHDNILLFLSGEWLTEEFRFVLLFNNVQDQYFLLYTAQYDTVWYKKVLVRTNISV